MIIFRTFYSKKTFDFVKKYLFTSYQGQPKKVQIESDYSFVLSNCGKSEILDYRVLEIAKLDKIAIRVLQDTATIGIWNKVLSLSLDGDNYNTIRIGTNRNLVEIIKTDNTEHQKITEF